MERSVPPLSALRCFQVAARLQSFTAAADALCLTPSAVSHQIKLLESFHGRQLFVRAGRRMLLTEAGSVYVARIAEAFRQIELGAEDLGRCEAVEVLVVSVAPSFAYAWLVPRLAHFIREYPHIRLKLVTTANGMPLDDSGADCEVRYGHGKWPNVTAECLCREQLRPVGSPGIAAQLALQGLDALGRAMLIHTRSRRSGWSEFARRHQVRLRPPEEGLQVDRTPLALEAARGGMGVALESRLLTAPYLRDGSLVTLFEASVEDEAYFFVHARHASGRKVAVFKAWLQDQLGTHEGQVDAAFA